MRKTPLLKAVTTLLEKADKPLSVPEMQVLLVDQNLTPNKTTLYRMLDKLVTDEMVEALLLDPKVTYYEIKTHHHHHFRCQGCDTIKCVDDPVLETYIHALEEKLAAKGLKVEDHHFSLNGKCNQCI